MIDTYAQSFGNASHVEDCGASCTVMEAIQYFPELCPLPDDDLNSCYMWWQQYSFKQNCDHFLRFCWAMDLGNSGFTQ